MKVGSLFSGIGGFDLGLERAGMRVVWQCEAEPYRRRVLARHWPGVSCYEDVRGVGGEAEPVDLICGGFPCTDLSLAGKGAGLDGAQSGLWFEMLRVVRELRPRYVVVENVAALLGRGLGRVVGDLAESGYDAEWDCIPASALGAPHRRDRLWIVAYPEGELRRAGLRHGDPRANGRDQPADGWRDRGEVQDPDSGALQPRRIGGRAPQAGGPGWWPAEPDVGRVAFRVPNRLDRLSALGDSLVPQIAEWIGRRIMNAEQPITEPPGAVA